MRSCPCRSAARCGQRCVWNGGQRRSNTRRSSRHSLDKLHRKYSDCRKDTFIFSALLQETITWGIDQWLKFGIMTGGVFTPTALHKQCGGSTMCDYRKHPQIPHSSLHSQSILSYHKNVAWTKNYSNENWRFQQQPIMIIIRKTWNECCTYFETIHQSTVEYSRFSRGAKLPQVIGRGKPPMGSRGKIPIGALRDKILHKISSITITGFP